MKKINGTASAVYAAKNFIDDEFILLYGDLFFDGSIDEIVRTPNSMTVSLASSPL